MPEICDTLKLCAYMFVTEKFNESKKLFESFCPLIETVLMQKMKTSISFLELHNEINSIYKTGMPKATLQRLLQQLQRENKIEIKKNIIHINGEYQSSKYIKERDEKETEINDLFLGFREYMLDKNIKLEVDDAKQIICNFLFTHCYDLAAFFNSENIPAREDVPHALLLCEYILLCKNSNIEQYHCFMKLYKGAVQTTLLNFQPEKIETLEKRQLNIKKVILDSNFVMRILDIQAELECTIAKETLQNVKKSGADIIVLRQTMEEIARSVTTFINEIAPYTQHTADYFRNKEIRFSGMYDALQRGKTRTSFFELTKYNNLVKKLSEDFGIQVVEDYETTKFSNEEIDSLIKKKGKITYQAEQAKHDLTLISYCSSLRKKRVSDFVDAEVWVLTNDGKLTSWDHDNSKPYQKCILEAQLSNMMWLENPKGDNLGLVNIITTLASREMVDEAKFHRFVDALQKLKAEDDPKTREMISLVFASDALCSEDINNIDRENYNIEKIFEEKSDKVRQKNKERENEIKSLKSLGKKHEYEQKISNLKIDVLTKEHEERDLRENLENQKKTLGDIARLECRGKRNARILRVLYWVLIFSFGIVAWLFIPWDIIIKFVDDYSYLWDFLALIFSFGIFGAIGAGIQRLCKSLAQKIEESWIKWQFRHNDDILNFIGLDLKEKEKRVSEKCKSINDEIVKIRTEIQDLRYELKQHEEKDIIE